MTIENELHKKKAGKERLEDITPKNAIKKNILAGFYAVDSYLKLEEIDSIDSVKKLMNILMYARQVGAGLR